MRVASRIAPRLNANSITSSVVQAEFSKSYAVAIWIAVIGIFLPPTPIEFGGATFTPARIVVCCLLIPALATLLKNGRRWVASDFFAITTAAWMIVSSVLNGGFRLYVCAEALDLLGPYLIGRAFFLGSTNLDTFSRVFRIAAIIVIALALLDTISGRYITLETFGASPASTQGIQPTNNVQVDPRYFRATSVFPNFISFGTFCAAAAAIFFYSERTTFRRIFFVCLSFFGCVLSLSSGPLLGFGIVAATICFDRVLERYPWRWKLLLAIVVVLLCAVFTVSNNPILWAIAHLTFNPATGYWRYTIWNLVFELLSYSPWVGFGLITFRGDEWWWFMLSLGIDCVWLVEAMRYGIPCVVLLAFTILLPFFKKSFERTRHLDEVRRGFSLAVSVFVLVGLTVHFWDTAWIFFFLCVGIRASFGERSTVRRRMRMRATLTSMERRGAAAANLSY